MSIHYRGQHIRCTTVKMRSALKLFDLGANEETLKRYMKTSTSRHKQFVRMVMEGAVHYVEGGKKKTIQLRRSESKNIPLAPREVVLIDEDLYGGVQGKLPDFTILWDKYQETIKQYKDRHEKDN